MTLPIAMIRRSEAAMLALVCLALRTVSLLRTCLSDDEAIYAVVAREMLAGRTLYRDADASANIVPESWDMLEDDVATRKPRLLVDTSPGNLAAYGKFPVPRFSRLRAILDRDYWPAGEANGIRVFVRREELK